MVASPSNYASMNLVCPMSVDYIHNGEYLWLDLGFFLG
jgi:hypothetical protein